MRYMLKSLKESTGEWEPWFAWRPVVAYAASTNAPAVIWLENVERKVDMVFGGYGMVSVRSYRFPHA